MKATWDPWAQFVMNTAGLLEIHSVTGNIHLAENGLDQIIGRHQPKRLCTLSEVNGHFSSTMIQTLFKLFYTL